MKKHPIELITPPDDPEEFCLQGKRHLWKVLPVDGYNTEYSMLGISSLQDIIDAIPEGTDLREVLVVVRSLSELGIVIPNIENEDD